MGEDVHGVTADLPIRTSTVQTFEFYTAKGYISFTVDLIRLFLSQLVVVWLSPLPLPLKNYSFRLSSWATLLSLRDELHGGIEKPPIQYLRHAQHPIVTLEASYICSVLLHCSAYRRYHDSLTGLLPNIYYGRVSTITSFPIYVYIRELCRFATETSLLICERGFCEHKHFHSRKRWLYVAVSRAMTLGPEVWGSHESHVLSDQGGLGQV